jgi:hypothetical protein
MKRPVRIHAALCTCLSFAIADSPRELRAQNDNDATIPAVRQQEPAVLVLHDGGVLVGQVTQTGDRYLLKRSGNEMQLPAASVMLVATSLEDAYNERRGRLAGPTADAHLALAEWCLRYYLLEQAARELEDARKIERQHPRLALLERRLSIARQRPKTKAAERPAESQPPPADRSERLDSSIGELPEAAIERFTRKVQPVLVNNCATSGCHDRGGTRLFQLDRAILHGMANRRATMHNLAATLELVDRKQPQQSPLLTVPREPHGGLEEPVFGPRQQAAFAHLVDWVALVTNSVATKQEEPPAADDAEETPAPRLTSPVLRVPNQSGELSTGRGTAADPTERIDSRSVPEAAGDIAPARFHQPVTPSEARRMQYGAQLKHWRPRDPFDPDIFNRQRRTTVQSAKAPAPETSNEAR